MHLLVQPTSQQLELEASVAWNTGDVESAERLSRRALYRNPNSLRACDVLIQVAHHNQRPELQAAATEMKWAALNRSIYGMLAAGDSALKNNILRIAEHYWNKGLRLNPSDTRFHQRLTTLAGMQLNVTVMQDRLLTWSKIAPPDPELVLLYFGLSSINARDASSAINILVESVEADTLDTQSRLGLGRCLLTMNNLEEAIRILPDNNRDSVVLQATVCAMRGDDKQAESLLANLPPNAANKSADWHFASGIVAANRQEWQTAEEQFHRAVELRPLSIPFRSRYCEVLRRNRNEDVLTKETASLERLREIVNTAATGAEALNESTVRRIKSLCAAIDAEEATTILDRTFP